MEGLTWTVIASFVSTVGIVITGILTYLTRKDVKTVHTQVNSRMDQLLAAAGAKYDTDMGHKTNEIADLKQKAKNHASK